MPFKCQQDSYLKKFHSKVLSCDPVRGGYNIVLEDTVLYPQDEQQFCNQPTDHGWLDSYPVRSVTQKGLNAVHFVRTSEVPFHVGQSVCQKVDWERRFDHMQQHTGQHLLSAVFEREFGISTNSWQLGEDSSWIDLATSYLDPAALAQVERVCNQLILEDKEVRVETYGPNDPMLEVERGHIRDAPGYMWDNPQQRVVYIDGIDANLCVGTHVRSLAQLQSIKLQKVKETAKGSRVYFVAGNRVLRKLGEHNDLMEWFPLLFGVSVLLMLLRPCTHN